MERETDRAAGTSPQTCKFNLRYRSFSKFLGPTAQAFLLDFLASVQSLTACTGAVNSRSQGNAWLIVDTMPRLSSRAPPGSSFAVCMKESPCTDCTNIKAKALITTGLRAQTGGAREGFTVGSMSLGFGYCSALLTRA